jgi:quinolinate synthase
MKLNTLEKVYLCLKNESPEILLDELIRKPAEKSILRMLEISSQLGI